MIENRNIAFHDISGDKVIRKDEHLLFNSSSSDRVAAD